MGWITQQWARLRAWERRNRYRGTEPDFPDASVAPKPIPPRDISKPRGGPV